MAPAGVVDDSRTQEMQADVAAALEQRDHVVERTGLRDVDLLQQTGNRLAQGAAEQRVVVRDHQAIFL